MDLNLSFIALCLSEDGMLPFRVVFGPLAFHELLHYDFFLEPRDVDQSSSLTRGWMLRGVLDLLGSNC